MTDPFEDAVRDALRGATSGPGDLPTYHDAWNRGRRRRLIKRSALTAAGALVLLAALTVNLGRLPGSDSNESSDVASSVEAATPVVEPTPLATTAPVQTPATTDPGSTPEANDDGAVAADAASSTGDSAAAPPESATEVPTAAPTTTAAPAPPTPAPPAAAEVTPAPVNPVPDTPTPVPPTSVPATPDPAASSPAPTTEALPTADTATDQNPGAASGTAEQPADPGSPDEPATVPEAAFTTGVLADAVLVGGAARGVPLPCDLDRDGIADATCELLADYPCAGDGDIRPGYSAVDTDGDQVDDTCMAQGLTMCDTTGDGGGDTPCIIDVSGIPGAEIDPSDPDSSSDG